MFDVNVQRLESCLEDMQRTIRDGLLAMDIWDRSSGLSLAGINSNPAATALFNRVTGELQETLSGAGFPNLGRYYLLDLEDDKLVVVCRESEDLMAGGLLDSKRANLGIVVGVALPKLLQGMREARQG